MNYNSIRRKTKEIGIGNVNIGGSNRIAIQSMTNTDTHDKEATLAQIKRLESKGCEIVRITVPDLEAADTISYLKESGVKIPIVADIHFDYKVALRCAEVGVDKIRINPGNIGDDENVRAVCKICNQKNIPIRIGVNGGSLEKDLLAKYGAPTAEAIVESALRHVSLLEKFDFYDIIVSLKSSDVLRTIQAYKLFAKKSDIPLHLGITEAGGGFEGVVKSSAGIGSMLSVGLGNTLRVSLTGNPVKEIETGKEILKAFDLVDKGVEIISCPTCGRTNVDLEKTVHSVKEAFRRYKGNITIAVMGCAVNGPGEAREADIGICGGKEKIS